MELQAHPHAEIFPVIDTNSFDELRRDIRQNGLLEPITLLEGQILDGRNRYRAMVSIDPAFSPATAPAQFVQFTGADPLAWVISKNLHRRHLNESQRAIIAARLSLANPGKNRFSPGFSSPAAAKLMNVSTGLVNGAKRLIKAKPSEATKVAQGEARVGRHDSFDGQVSAAIGVGLRNEFHRLCADLGRSNTDVLTELIRLAVQGKIKLERSQKPFVLGDNRGRRRTLSDVGALNASPQ